MTNQTTRVLELLKRFNDGQIVCIDNLAMEDLWYGKSEKTIRRDLDVIKNVFDDSFELVRGGQKGCYKAITNKAFEGFLSPQNISLMVQVFNIAQQSSIFDGLKIDDNDRAIIERKVKEQQNIYEFKTKPFENKLKNFKLFNQLENSIKYKKSIIIKYETAKGELTEDEVNPHKIVFMQENFYLACEIKDSEYEFMIYRVSKIQEITATKKTFHKNYEIDKFIKDMQTPFSLYQRDYRKHLVDVLLEIDSSKAIFFKMKKHLKSEDIIETKENGNLLVKYRVTQTREVEEIIMKWIPFIKVIEPKELKDSIDNRLRNYLNSTK